MLRYTTRPKSQLESKFKPPFPTSYEPYTYQKQASVIIDAIYGLNDEEPQNILVASPTGSGKSYLIKAAAVRAAERGERLVVGVPLVALAEQTYHNLKRVLKPFGDDEILGIATGPTEVNEHAPILVCTYEVILTKQNRDFAFMDNVGCIIIDEIHFISGDRGNQIEQILNELPVETYAIGLSGTIPNKDSFANAMGRCTKKPTCVLGLDRRPISLNYMCHVGEPKQSFVYLCSRDDSGQRSTAARWKKGAWKYVASLAEKRPERLSFRQKRGRLLQLIKNCDKRNMLPALMIDFSCKALNNYANSLKSMDLVDRKRDKSFVHRAFENLRKRIPQEEWSLFDHLEDMARRGFAVFHSQQPKHYLELVPDLVKQGLIRAIFATSSLSTGIDLPVKSVVVLSLTMPSKKDGFKPIEASLLQQIFGRSGRPGQETVGNAIITAWTQLDPRLDVAALLTAPAEEVVAHGMVRPRPVLSRIQRNYAPESILESPFSSIDRELVDEQLRSITAKVDGMKPNMDIVQKYFAMERVHSAGKRKRWNLEKGDDIVVYSPPKKRLAVRRVSVGGFRPLRLDTGERISYKHVISDDPESSDAAILLHVDSANDSERELAHRAYHEVKRGVDLVNSVKPENHPLYDELQTLLDRLRAQDFVDEEGVITFLGRLVPCIVGCDDPLTLAYAWTSNAIRRDSVEIFCASLSVFLQNKRYGEPDDTRGVIAPLQELQEKVSGEENLGTAMIEPMVLWCEGHSVAKIVGMTDAPVGHVCKTVQRLSQLLEQLEDAGTRIGDRELSMLCAQSQKKVKRGLPFVDSIYII